MPVTFSPPKLVRILRIIVERAESEQQIFISLSRLLLCIAALWLAHIAPTKDATLRFLNVTAKKDRGFKEAQNKEFFSPIKKEVDGQK